MHLSLQRPVFQETPISIFFLKARIKIAQLFPGNPTP